MAVFVWICLHNAADLFSCIDDDDMIMVLGLAPLSIKFCIVLERYMYACMYVYIRRGRIGKPSD